MGSVAGKGMRGAGEGERGQSRRDLISVLRSFDFMGDDGKSLKNLKQGHFPSSGLTTHDTALARSLGFGESGGQCSFKGLYLAGPPYPNP